MCVSLLPHHEWTAKVSGHQCGWLYFGMDAEVLPHDHAFSISIPDYACCYLFINRPKYLLDTPYIVSDSFLTGAYKF